MSTLCSLHPSGSPRLGRGFEVKHFGRVVVRNPLNMIPGPSCALKLCRWLAALSAGLIGGAVGRAAEEVPAQLMQAFVNLSREDNHWAYTETTVVRPKSAKDQADVLTVVRVDPSKPYAEQYTPLLVEGHKPTARELKEYRQKGEKRADELEKGETRGRGGRGGPGERGQDEFKALLDAANIKVTAETATAITYHVPLRKGAKAQGVALDKIEFDVRITKEEKPTIEHMEMHLLGSMRVMLVANVKAANFSVDFAKVDPKYAPVLTRVKGAAKVSVLLVARMSPAIDQTRTDYERVEPYDNRFKVQIGPLKILNP